MKTLVCLLLLFSIYQSQAQSITISNTSSSSSVVVGGTISFQINVSGAGGFNQQIHFTDSSDNYHLQTSFSTNDLFYPYTGGTILTVQVPSSVSVGSHLIVVKASNGPIESSLTINFDVIQGVCSWTTYTRPPGYGSNAFLCRMAIDTAGNVWTGGYHLLKFDGTNWTDLSSASSGITDDEIYDIKVDHSNNIWVAAYSRLIKYDGIFWTVFDSANSILHSKLINSIDFDVNNRIWIGTRDSGVYSYDGIGNWNHYTTSNSGLTNNRIGKIKVSASGNVYAMTIGDYYTKNNFNIYENGNWRALTHLNSELNSRSLTDFSIDSSGNVWIVGDNTFPDSMGLIKYDGSNIERWWPSYHRPFNHILKDSASNTITSDNSSGLNAMNLQRVFIDDANNIWMTLAINGSVSQATGPDKGIQIFNGHSSWAFLNSANSTLPGDGILFYAEGKGKIWIDYGVSFYGDYGDPYRKIASFNCNASSLVTGLLDNYIQENDIKIYPNPAANEVRFELDGSVDCYKVTMLDLQGREVYNDQNCNTNHGTIDISYIANGLYVVNIMKDGKNHSTKLLIEK